MSDTGSSTTEWIGTNGGDWNDPDNWTNGLPTSGITAIINSKTPLSINLDGNTYSSGDLAVMGGSSVTLIDGTLNMSKETVTVAQDTTLALDNATVDTSWDVHDLNGTGAVTGGTILISNNSSLICNYTTSNISFSGPGNEIYQHFSGYIIPQITNLSPDDRLRFASDDWNGCSWGENSNGTFTLYGAHNNVLVSSITMAPGVTPGDFRWDYMDAGLICFLPGSMIRTMSGDIAVEDLAIGDQVTVVGQDRQTSTIKWIGKSRATAKVGMPLDMSDYPVRILANAIADGVPYKDMLITPEHCLFFEGKFIPARMLVNGATIFFDTSIKEYDYYHVETERHSVIIADGMTTESYLDTGNRKMFTSIGDEGEPTSWEEGAFAPLGTSPDFVRPIYQAIFARKNSLNIVSNSSVTNNQANLNHSDLRLILDNGKVIRPVRKVGNRVHFLLPKDVRNAKIASNASRPSDTIGPFYDDRRYMGVSVGSIHIVSANKLTPVTSHLQQENLSGWHCLEGTQSRCTNGYAHLPLPQNDTMTCKILSLEITSSGPHSIAA